MKTNKLVVGLPIMFSLLLTGCSGGETPSLPEANSATSTSADSGSSSTPTASPTGSSSTATDSPVETKDGMVTPPPPTNDTGVDIPGVKPYTYSTVPATAIPPVYENDTPAKPQEVPADATPAFAVYAAFHDALSKEDWAKACEYVEIGEGKSKQFCIDWYQENKAVTGSAPKMEDFNVRQEINSNSIVLVSKDPANVSQKQIKINPSGNGWKVSISPITTDK